MAKDLAVGPAPDPQERSEAVDMATMSPLDSEIDAFRRLLPELEAKHMGKWVLIYQHSMIGVYSAFDAAADEAVQRFGSGPFLIRQVGAKPVALPASLAYTRPSA